MQNSFNFISVNLKNPETAEAELISEWKVYDKNGDTSISADNLFDWIEYYYPELTIDQARATVHGEIMIINK